MKLSLGETRFGESICSPLSASVTPLLRQRSQLSPRSQSRVIGWRSRRSSRVTSKVTAARGQIKPKRGYSQNFLVDESISREIALEADLDPGDTVFEIGPGTGSLTDQLLEASRKVVAIEADPRLQKYLAEKYCQEIENGRLALIEGDITRVNLRQIFGSDPQRRTSQKVVANLPFNITTDVLKLLLPLGDVISEIFVMLQAAELTNDVLLVLRKGECVSLQLEAAQRLCGENPGNSDYRAMSVLVDFYSQATASMQIGRASFEPQPNVDCQMVRFELRRPEDRLEVPSEQSLMRIVNICFGSRRKTLRNNLKAVFPLDAVTTAMQAAGLDDNVRPQELAVPDFAALSRTLCA